MKIILLKDVAKVGKKFEEKEVSQGFAMNSLIPRGLALVATPEVIKRLRLEKEKMEGEKKVHTDLLVKNLKTLEGKKVTATCKANEKGHLFASIHAGEIAEMIKTQLHLDIDPEHIKLTTPIKSTGEHSLVVKAHDTSVKCIFSVVAQ